MILASLAICNCLAPQPCLEEERRSVVASSDHLLCHRYEKLSCAPGDWSLNNLFAAYKCVVTQMWLVRRG